MRTDVSTLMTEVACRARSVPVRALVATLDMLLYSRFWRRRSSDLSAKDMLAFLTNSIEREEIRLIRLFVRASAFFLLSIASASADMNNPPARIMRFCN